MANSSQRAYWKLVRRRSNSHPLPSISEESEPEAPERAQPAAPLPALEDVFVGKGKGKEMPGPSAVKKESGAPFPTGRLASVGPGSLVSVAVMSK